MRENIKAIGQGKGKKSRIRMMISQTSRLIVPSLIIHFNSRINILDKNKKCGLKSKILNKLRLIQLFLGKQILVLPSLS